MGGEIQHSYAHVPHLCACENLVSNATPAKQLKIHHNSSFNGTKVGQKD